jgi:hypothetical protein
MSKREAVPAGPRMTLFGLVEEPAAPAEPKPQPVTLFNWLDSIFNRSVLQGTPPLFMMHRFLASDESYAVAARYLQQDVSDPQLAIKVWQGLVDYSPRAPRLQYVAAKAPPAAEELIGRMMTTLSIGRRRAEEMIALVRTAGELDALYAELGVET